MAGFCCKPGMAVTWGVSTGIACTWLAWVIIVTAMESWPFSWWSCQIICLLFTISFMPAAIWTWATLMVVTSLAMEC